MGVETILLILGGLLTAVLGAVGWAVRTALNNVSDKLDNVLSNQHTQEVTIAEIKKDVHNLLSKDVETSSKLSKLEGTVNELEKHVAELKEFKRNQEK